MSRRAAFRSIAHRRVEPLDGLEFFPTPPWATRALVEHVIGKRGLRRLTVHEPACGEGHMAAVLEEYFGRVISTDVFPYGFGGVRDFLDTMFMDLVDADWIITNPPFEKAVEFVELALERATLGVAMFVRAGFITGKARYRRLFKPFPPTCVAHFAERAPLHKGRWDPEGETATDYVWLVWRKAPSGALLAPRATVWIPPSRKFLTRRDDVARFGVKVEPVACPLFEEAA